MTVVLKLRNLRRAKKGMTVVHRLCHAVGEYSLMSDAVHLEQKIQNRIAELEELRPKRKRT